MPVMDLAEWMDTHSRQGTVWFAKRLSANDTLANRAHAYGSYLPKQLVFDVFPAMDNKAAKNPDTWIDLYVDSHPDRQKARVIWYNNSYHFNRARAKKGTRDEARITNLGGKSSPLLDPESTGSIAVFVFVLDEKGSARECHVWVTDNEAEEDQIEERFGPVEPKVFLIWKPGLLPLFANLETPAEATCWLGPSQMPKDWLTRFPTGQEIVKKTLELQPARGLSIDERIMRRRACEFQLFQSIEEAVYLPKIRKGFDAMGQFLGLAQTILQSRKSRSGKSLEYHAREVLTEEAFVANKDFTHNPIIDGNPDFIFPSAAAYNDASFPASKLRMLAAKTTCKERWGQVTKEAKRVKIKHLLTLQEGVSQSQFKEMIQKNLRLVVPQKLHATYHREIRPHLMTFESFLAEVRSACSSDYVRTPLRPPDG
jgi:hypothetical protein